MYEPTYDELLKQLHEATERCETLANEVIELRERLECVRFIVTRPDG